MKPPCQPWSSMTKRITGTRSEAPSKKPISTRLRAMPRRASNQRETKVWKGIKNIICIKTESRPLKRYHGHRALVVESSR